MAEYIEKEALIERLKVTPLFIGQENIRRGVIDLVNWYTTADVVEVVRCKDCVYWDWYVDDSRYGSCNGLGLGCMHEDDFCSLGERRNGDG